MSRLIKYKSIDGIYSGSLRLINDIKNINKNDEISILGAGKSISKIPYVNNLPIFQINDKKFIKIIKDNIVSVSANVTCLELYNFLIKNGLVFENIPSYPDCTIGGCIANCVHGFNPKFGTIRDKILEIDIYNGHKMISINKKDHYELFNFTIGGMGKTGIIYNAKILVDRISYTHLKIKKTFFYSLTEGYSILKKSKFVYNQNNIFIDYSNKKLSFYGICNQGTPLDRKDNIPILKKKKIPSIRLGLLGNIFILQFFNKFIFITSKFSLFNKLSLSDVIFSSNKRVNYFLLMSKKFIEYQSIIPHKNVINYFTDIEKLFNKFRPIVTLIHFKIFSEKGEYYQFTDNGLSVAYHFQITRDFKIFYEEFVFLEKKYSTLPNLYKNSFSNKNTLDCYINKRKELNSYKSFQSKFTNSIYQS
jgi:hypothetical protein